MNKFSFVKILLFAMVAVFFAVSCDDDYDQLGTDIVGGDIHNSTHLYSGSVVAYDRPTGPVQTSGLDMNLLGAYTHPVFGKTTASYITQVQMSTVPTFTNNVVIDSAWIYVPYYSTLKNTSVLEGTTVNTYTLDSIYGDTLASYRLKLRKNEFYIRTTDAGTGGSTSQFYYSDQSALLEGSNVGESLFEKIDDEITTFSNTEIKRTAKYLDDDNKEQTAIAETLAPGLFKYLNKDFFKNHFVNAPSGKLMNNNVLAEYFRGISFSPEQISGKEVMGALKFTDGYIKVKYTQDDYDANNKPIYETVDGVKRVKRESLTLQLNLAGNHINLLRNEPNNTYLTAINSSNTTEGDEKLYLKGGEGSMAFIDILSANEIADLKKDSILINEARLTFYVDQAAMNAATTPMRVYLYDVNNKRQLYDYALDPTSSTIVPAANKQIFGGNRFEYVKDNYLYSIRLTNHINNIINKDSTNVKLGLVVSRDILLTGNAALKAPFNENGATGTVPVKVVPTASVTHPSGVVLHGSNPAVPADKLVKLEIFYTKTKEGN